MNAYGQIYMQQSSSSANVGRIYVPQSYESYMRAHKQTKDAGSQTQLIVKRSSEATTQTDLIGDVIKIRPKAPNGNDR